MPAGRAFAHFNLHCCLRTMTLRIKRPVFSTVLGDWAGCTALVEPPGGGRKTCTSLFGHSLHITLLICANWDSKRGETSSNWCLIFLRQGGVEKKKSWEELFWILFLSAYGLIRQRLNCSCTACSFQRSGDSENHKECEDKRGKNVLL